MKRRIPIFMAAAVCLLPAIVWALQGERQDHREQIWLQVELRSMDEVEPKAEAQAAQPLALIETATRLGEPVDVTATIAGTTVRVQGTLNATEDRALRGSVEFQASKPFEMHGGAVVVTTTISHVRTHIRLERDEPVELAGVDDQREWQWIVLVRSREDGGR